MLDLSGEQRTVVVQVLRCSSRDRILAGGGGNVEGFWKEGLAFRVWPLSILEDGGALECAGEYCAAAVGQQVQEAQDNFLERRPPYPEGILYSNSWW